MIKKDNMKRYFVEMTPMGYYFFGSERTFDTISKDKYGEKVTNYFAESNVLPQQTAVLGLMRYAILVINNALNATQSIKDSLIGSAGFEIGIENSFQLIDQISPLVLFHRKTNQVLYPKGLDSIVINNVETTMSYATRTQNTYINGAKSTIPSMTEFDYKTELKNHWWDGTNTYKEETIFKSITKVGVNIDAEEKGFYKQMMKGLNKDFSMGIWIDFRDDIDVSNLNENLLLPFGADQGMFVLKFRTDIECSIAENTSSTVSKIILMTDAWMDESDFTMFDFGITQYTDFRFIKSKQVNYYKSVDKTKNKFTLLQRGSVLYPNSSFDMSKIEKPIFRKIGYNYFKTI